MLAQAARLGGRVLGRRLGTSGGKAFFGASGERAVATEAAASGKDASRSFGWGTKLVAGTALLAAGIYLGDLYMNDDLDNLSELFRTRLSEEERKNRPKVVILGTGWGAMSMLRKLHTDQFDVTVVSPRNYFLFTPLLASTTSGLLDVRSIMEPVRRLSIRTKSAEARFIEMEAQRIDPVQKKVVCVDNSAVQGAVTNIELDYDYLVVSVGAETATFGIPGVAENAIYLKSVQNARKIRETVMDCFETAMIPGQPKEEIDRLLHFVVAGGGPAGVEFTAELYDFITRDLSASFPEVASHVRISLVEALPKILPMLDAKLIEYTTEKLNATRQVKVCTKRAVTKVEPKQLTIKNTETGELQNIPYGTLVWATGNAPVPLTKDLIQTLGPANQPVPRGLSVDDHLRVKGADNIFAVGDCALSGRLPPTAQVASQEGRFLARIFNQYADEMHSDTLARKNTTTSAISDAATIAAASKFHASLTEENKFNFHYLGTMAYIGGSEAVADYGEGNGKHHGYTTWLLWRSVYMSKLLSSRNRVLVASDWTRAFLFGRDISRG